MRVPYARANGNTGLDTGLDGPGQDSWPQCTG